MKIFIHSHPARTRDARDARKASSAWLNVVNDPKSKSYEVASANAKELYRLRKLIDEVERSSPSTSKERAGLEDLRRLYSEIEAEGKRIHQAKPVSGVMRNVIGGY